MQPAPDLFIPAVQFPAISLAAVHEAGHFLALVSVGVSAVCSTVSDEPGQSSTLFFAREVAALTPRQRYFTAIAGPVAAAFWQGDASPLGIAREFSADDLAGLDGKSFDDSDVEGAYQDVLAFLPQRGCLLAETAALLTRDKVMATDAWLCWEGQQYRSVVQH